MVEVTHWKGAYGTRTPQERTHRRDRQARRAETRGAAKRRGAQGTCSIRRTGTLAPTGSPGSAREGPGDHVPRHTGIKRQATTARLISAVAAFAFCESNYELSTSRNNGDCQP